MIDPALHFVVGANGAGPESLCRKWQQGKNND
jgi:hypothetical protein